MAASSGRKGLSQSPQREKEEKKKRKKKKKKKENFSSLQRQSWPHSPLLSDQIGASLDQGALGLGIQHGGARHGDKEQTESNHDCEREMMSQAAPRRKSRATQLSFNVQEICLDSASRNGSFPFFFVTPTIHPSEGSHLLG